MADMLMLAQMGLNIAGGWSEYQNAKTDWDYKTKSAELQYKSDSIAAETTFKLNKAYQSYRNVINTLGAREAENRINVNRAALHDADAEMDQDIQIQAMRDRGAAAVARGGQTGNSVTLVMRDLASSAAKAQFNRVENLKSQYLKFAYDKADVRTAAVLNKDVTVHTKEIISKPVALPKPSSASAFLGIATDMLNTYDENQTPGNTIADTWSRWGL